MIGKSKRPGSRKALRLVPERRFLPETIGENAIVGAGSVVTEKFPRIRLWPAIPPGLCARLILAANNTPPLLIPLIRFDSGGSIYEQQT